MKCRPLSVFSSKKSKSVITTIQAHNLIFFVGLLVAERTTGLLRINWWRCLAGCVHFWSVPRLWKFPVWQQHIKLVWSSNQKLLVIYRNFDWPRLIVLKIWVLGIWHPEYSYMCLIYVIAKLTNTSLLQEDSPFHCLCVKEVIILLGTEKPFYFSPTFSSRCSCEDVDKSNRIKWCYNYDW